MENKYADLLNLLRKQMKELDDAIENNMPDFVINDLACVVNGTTGDMLTYSPTAILEKEMAELPLTDEELTKLNTIINNYNDNLQFYLKAEYREFFDKAIRLVNELLTEVPRDNKKIRDIINGLDVAQKLRDE